MRWLSPLDIQTTFSVGRTTAFKLIKEFKEQGGEIIQIGKLKRVSEEDFTEFLVEGYQNTLKNAQSRRSEIKYSKTKLYKVWQAMKSRCTNPHDENYFRYGGRGIKVCEEWESCFKVFFEWSLNNGYEEGLTIDRINNDEGYSPANCRWTSRTIQQNNIRSNHLIEYNGEKHSISEWARIVGISQATLSHRILNGWDVEKALFTEPLSRGMNVVLKERSRHETQS